VRGRTWRRIVAALAAAHENACGIQPLADAKGSPLYLHAHAAAIVHAISGLLAQLKQEVV